MKIKQEVKIITLDNNIPLNEILLQDIIDKRAVMNSSTYKNLLLREVKNPINWIWQLLYIFQSLFNLISISILNGFMLLLLLFVMDLSYFQTISSNEDYILGLFSVLLRFSGLCFILLFLIKLYLKNLGIRNIFKEQVFKKL